MQSKYSSTSVIAELDTLVGYVSNFQNFLGAIADVIEIFTGVVKAIQNGVIANIANAIA